MTTPEPPVIKTISPIIDLPILLTRNTAMFAISPGMINLPRGFVGNDISSFIPFGISIGVAVGPGAIAFTVIP